MSFGHISSSVVKLKCGIFKRVCVCLRGLDPACFRVHGLSCFFFFCLFVCFLFVFFFFIFLYYIYPMYLNR